MLNLFGGCVALAVIIMTTTAARADHPPRPTDGQIIRLWEGAAPRAMGDKDADIPTLTAYMPEQKKANGCAVIVCPGGGYSSLVMDKEGSVPAKWLNDHGITAFVLKYRIDPYGQPAPMLDGQRAIRLVRYNSKAWGIDWRRIGIMGFSAGGHVASTVGTHFDPYIPAATDPVNRQSCRPDFMILVYPVISMRDKITHPGSRRILLGDHPPQKLINLYSNETQVTDDTPPTFIVAAKPDSIVPVKNSELFAEALKRHDVPYEFLELPIGEHGFGLGQSDPRIGIWTDRCLAFLKKEKFLKSKPE
jgi:acetyl esterase/lipase